MNEKEINKIGYDCLIFKELVDEDVAPVVEESEKTVDRELTNLEKKIKNLKERRNR